MRSLIVEDDIEEGAVYVQAFVRIAIVFNEAPFAPSLVLSLRGETESPRC